MTTLLTYLLLFIFMTNINLIQSHGIRNDDLIVKLVSPSGKIRGHIQQSANGNNYYAFQEIPYAAPPINNLRFKLPQKHDGWDGILNTTVNTKRCPQGWILEGIEDTEDCLYLNVYTPVKPNSNKKLAVYVWIYGGGYIIGDGTSLTYHPKYLMDYDIVVVTLNYRLGALGFLTTDDGVIPGNLGLRDQNFALRWVNENIHLFGGDPKKVTIGGESSGGSSVSYQMLSNFDNENLFRGAIQQSGSVLNRWGFQDKPVFYAFEFGKLFDKTLVQGNSTHLLQILLKLNTSQIIEGQGMVVSREKIVGLDPDNIFVPIVEKTKNPFIGRPMFETLTADRSVKWNRVPTLIGFNAEESLWFLPSPNNNSWEKSWEEVRERAAITDSNPSNLVSDKLNIREDKKNITGIELKKVYTNGTFVDDIKAFVRFISDSFVIQPIIRQAVYQAHQTDVYLYQFSYTTRQATFLPGALHTEELQYFWGGDWIIGEQRDFQKTIRRRLLKMWTNFIKYQNPTPTADSELNNILWPKLHNLEYLDINVNMKIKQNPRNYNSYAKALDRYMMRPFYVF